MTALALAESLLPISCTISLYDHERPLQKYAENGRWIASTASGRQTRIPFSLNSNPLIVQFRMHISVLEASTILMQMPVSASGPPALDASTSTIAL